MTTTMTLTTAELRELNRWLKANVPFHAKAWRSGRDTITVGAETGNDIGTYVGAIVAEFGGRSLSGDAPRSLPNYVTLSFE